MTKNEFKIGDRVREKENPCRFGAITSINHYDDPDCLVVRFDDEDERVCYVTDLEIYPDRKTAFLRELQALMRKYDASIDYFIGDDDKYGWSDYPILKIGNEVIKYPAGDIDEINADNIMNFDKE